MGNEKHDEYLATLRPALSRQGSDSATPKQVTVRIREEIKSALDFGALPPGTKVSVTCKDYKSIRVAVTAFQGAVFCDEFTAYYYDQLVKPDPSREFEGDRRGYIQSDWRNGGSARYTKALNDTLRLLETLGNRHNYDNSDIQTDYFDVGYYFHCDAHGLAAMAEHGMRLEFDPKFASLMGEAHAAAKRLGTKVVKSICGAGGVDACGEWSLARLIGLDQEAKGRQLTYSKSRGRWIVEPSATSAAIRGAS